MADTIKSEDASDVVRGCMAHASTPHCVTQITKTQVPKENNNPSPAGGASTGSSNKDTPMSTSATPGDEQPMDTTEVATLREDTAPPAGNSNPADVAVENKKQPTPKPEPVHQPPHSPKPAVQRPKQPSPLAHDSDGNIGGARGDNEDDDDDDEDEDEEATTTKEHTNHHVKQAGETLDQVEYKGSAYDKPMMEMHAGSNVWYQATVVHVSLNEVKAVFPAVEDGGKDVTQWVHKASSRIWRGSLKSRDWKYLGKGAWEPRNSGVVKAGGGQRGPGVRKRRRGRPRGSGGAGAGGEDTGTGTSEGVTGTAAQHEEEHASPHVGGRPRGRRRKGGADTKGAADPLAQWFQLHFTMLHKTGLLGHHGALDSPEAGCLPLPSIKPL